MSRLPAVAGVNDKQGLDRLEKLVLDVNAVLSHMLVLFGLALVITLVGFYRVVYFISIGYAFSIVGMALVTTLLLRENLAWATAVQNVLLVLWGLRLGTYLVRRESRFSYRRELEDTHQRSAGMRWRQKLLIWISVCALYVLMFSPSLFSLTAPLRTEGFVPTAIQSLGLFMMAGGLLLEAVADKQKSDFKSRNPDRFCDAGLYRWVRCPNYLGEIVFWLGNWVAGLPFYASPFQWLASLVGLICIVLIMMGSAKRLERTQGARYGSLPEYQAYIRSVPILFPLVPVYTLENVRVFLE